MTKYKIYKLGDKYFIKIKGWFFYRNLGTYNFQCVWGGFIPPPFEVSYYESEKDCESYMQRQYGKTAERLTKPVLV